MRDRVDVRPVAAFETRKRCAAAGCARSGLPAGKIVVMGDYDEDAYVRKAGRPTDERRRRRRAAIVLVVVAILLVGLLVVGLAVNRGWIAGGLTRPSAAPTAPCTPTPTLSASTVQLNVYNGTERAGLAAGAAAALDRQGFRIQAVKNDPLGRRVTGVGEIRHGAKGAAAAALLAGRVPGTKLVRDARTDAALDLVVGSGFTAVPKYTSPPTPAC